ncbi:M56 family metallopeptidase [Sabulilitoribacter multivorans]|uniref:M56 family metallopeptidase n=1 Tax=Flaviramulus multivorans TaxID=1304750 RepID=A0ABS9IGS2_9FLAO|nr:M56 family metallopeptidase [Flaviramulus multivorans]MCF7559954.1 M56 family metallopeptidase [Flaviramulus multivorans]
MLLYILKSSACLAIFMLFYKLCLEKTSVHTFKRFYLIAAILISIGIPFITFIQYVEVQPLNFTNDINNINTADLIESKTFMDYLPTILWTVYILGAALFLFRFIKNLFHLFKTIQENPKLKTQNFINVLLKDLIAPHTFFNYIFLNKVKYDNHQIPREVLLHEQTHARQKHALDILFIEILQIIFWFNPLLYFIKKDIKLNHEFLADQAVINKGINTKHYQQLLLAFSSNASNYQLANAINYSLIKKRFTVMKTKTSKTSFWLRSLLLLPLLAISLYSFSNKKEVITDIPIELTQQQKASKEQIAEYNKLAKKYNEQPENNRKINLKDLNRLEYLYGLMSKEQKANAEPFPNFPPPPPPPLPAFDEDNMSPELLKLKEAFYKKTKEYGEAVRLYVKENEGSSDALKKNYEEVMALYTKFSNMEKKKNQLIPPPPPPAPKEPEPKKAKQPNAPTIKKKVEVPPSPPTPKSPLDHVIEMAKKGANFYYEGKPISSDKAIKLMKENKNLNISTNSNDGVSIVKIQTKPITY